MGEFELIEQLAAALQSRHPGVATGIGDDAAVLAGGLCLSTDLLVEDVHFRRSHGPLDDVGWKALAVSLSDLAAMGAEPMAALVALGLPDGADDAVALYRGLDACAREFGVEIAGGDVSRAPGLTLCVTALGTAARPVLRSGARAGDLLAVTGALGGSRAGLALLDGDVADAPHRQALIERHRRPQPRVSEGLRLVGRATAMLDLSDGLAGDALRLAQASGVLCRIDLDRVPVQPGAEAVAAALRQPAGWFAAAGGEDYELLVALPADRVAGSGLHVVGEVAAGGAGVTFSGRGSESPPSGYVHH